MKKQIDAIQHLRLLASALVLFGHSLHEVGASRVAGYETFHKPTFLDWGVGVDVFFVISGFVMYHTSAHRYGEKGAALAFMRNRLLRVAPLYWIFTTLMLVAVLALPGSVDNKSLDPAYVASSYAFLPWPRPDGLLRPVLALGWTLNYEMLFYSLFAASLLLPRRVGLGLLIGVLAGAAALHPLLGRAGWVLDFWSDPIVLEFLAGMGVAKLYGSGWKLPGWFAAVLALGGLGVALGLVAAGVDERAIRNGVPSVMWVAAVVLGPWRLTAEPANSALNFGGDASYALYLCHPFALNVVSLFWTKLHLGSPWAFVAASCVASMAAAAAVHLGVEKPLARLLRSRRKPVELARA